MAKLADYSQNCIADRIVLFKQLTKRDPKAETDFLGSTYLCPLSGRFFNMDLCMVNHSWILGL